MVDLSSITAVNPNFPQDSNNSDDVLRQTEHRALSQSAPPGTPEVSYEAEDYQPAANLESYQPPAGMPTEIPITSASPNMNNTPPSVPPAPAPQPSPKVPPSPAQDRPTSQPRSTDQSRFPGIEKPRAEEIVFEWESLSRPFKKRGRQYYSTGLIIMILISMILFFAQQFLPIAVVIAVGFLAYVLSVVPPGMIKHSITTYGIHIEDTLYYWDELGRFWFSKKYGQNILHIEVARFPWRLTLLLGDVPEAEMTEILSEVLLQQKPAPTAMEKASEWLQAKIPLDNDPD